MTNYLLDKQELLTFKNVGKFDYRMYLAQQGDWDLVDFHTLHNELEFFADILFFGGTYFYTSYRKGEIIKLITFFGGAVKDLAIWPHEAGCIYFKPFNINY